METEQNYVFSWDGHKENMISVIQNLYSSEKNFDCTLSAEGQTFYVHRVIVSSCSPLLENILRDHAFEKPVITLDGVSALELRTIVEYMYTGETNVAHEHLTKFFETTKMLQICGLRDYITVEENDILKQDTISGEMYDIFEVNDLINNKIVNEEVQSRVNVASVAECIYNNRMESTMHKKEGIYICPNFLSTEDNKSGGEEDKVDDEGEDEVEEEEGEEEEEEIEALDEEDEEEEEEDEELDDNIEETNLNISETRFEENEEPIILKGKNYKQEKEDYDLGIVKGELDDESYLEIGNIIEERSIDKYNKGEDTMEEDKEYSENIVMQHMGLRCEYQNRPWLQNKRKRCTSGNNILSRPMRSDTHAEHYILKGPASKPVIAVQLQDKKNFMCLRCGNKYAHKRTLLHHIHWICQQPATYSCSLCPYMGKRKFQLKSHMKHAHMLNTDSP